MPVFLPYEALVNELASKIAEWAAVPFTLHLFTSPATWTLSTVKVDLVEATFPGYAVKNLTTWSPPLIFFGVFAISTTPALVWTVSATWAGEVIQGAYVLDGAGDLRGMMGLPGGPHEMRLIGDQISANMELTVQNPVP